MPASPPTSASTAATAAAASGLLVPGAVTRAPTTDDLEMVVGLFAAAAAARGGSSPGLRREDLRIRWLMLDDLDDAVLVLDASDQDHLLAYGSAPVDVETLPETGTLEAVVHLEGEVHPDHRGRGLANFLLDRAVAAGVAALADAANGPAPIDAPAAAALADADRPPHPPLRTDGPSTARVRVRTALVDGTAAEREWFAARGFTAVRHLLELRLDLHAPPPGPRWPAGVTVRTFRPGEDEEVLWRAHQAAFADVPTHLPIDRDDFLTDRAPADDPGLVLLAEHAKPEPEVIAVAVCRAGTEVAAEEGWVRDLGVLPAWRRRGVAMALLRAAFARFRERGLTGVALEVDDVTLDGAVALYRRAGMRVTHRTDVLERSHVVELSPSPQAT